MSVYIAAIELTCYVKTQCGTVSSDGLKHLMKGTTGPLINGGCYNEERD